MIKFRDARKPPSPPLSGGNNWRFWLFLFGAGISAGLSGFAIYTIAFVSVDISWALCVLILSACALPCVLFGLPLFNAKFYVSYSKEYGLKIGEEKRKSKRRGKTAERQEHAEWCD
jgi:Na+/melibiose symporter-like transporter